MSFASTWMDLGIIIVSAVKSGGEKFTTAYMWSLKKLTQVNLFAKQK